MLSEDTIRKLVQPIVDRAEAINTFVLQRIAKRIREIGKVKSSDVHRLEMLYQTGADVQLIEKEIERLTGLQIKDIKRIIRTAALENYIDAKPFYVASKRPYLPFNENIILQRIVNAVAQQTANTFVNLSNSQATGFLIRDLKNPSVLKMQSIGDTYRSVVDEAIQASQSGIIDYKTAMRRTMTQLVDSGVRRLHWDSGYSQRLDTAVRRNLLDGIRQINQNMQDEIGKQIGSDGKEISVHQFSAPDHEPVQGRQFTNEEYEKLQSAQPFIDFNGKQYKAIERPIGMWNCRHYTFSIILGAKPMYTEDQLKAFADKNAKGYTFKNGKHMTMYECTQEQRRLETEIRKMKDGQIAARESEDQQLAQYYQARINKLTTQYKQFSKSCGLSEKLTKMTVAGYRKISIKN